MLFISVSAYKQAGAERKSDQICRKVDGGGICRRPGRESNTFLLTYIPIQLLECLVCVGLRGNVNSLFNYFVIKLHYLHVSN